MKRRNFLKGLSILPVSLEIFRRNAKEDGKRVKPLKPEPQPVVRRTLGPQTGENLTACCFVVDADWYPKK